MSLLSITDSFNYDNSIESYEFHSYKPYVTSFGLNDEIRIPINQQDLYVLPSASALFVEGYAKIINRETKAEIKEFQFTNNPILFLFQDIRYELNGVEIDKVRNAGITTTMKSLLSMSEGESKMSKSWGWDINGTNNVGNYFSASIPLSKILGFAEDYNKIIVNCKHELILLRSNTNVNACKLEPQQFIEKIEISKIVWRVPHIKVNDSIRLNLLQYLEKDRALNLTFRNWDLYEYPVLPKTSNHTWSIKTSSQIEKPRFVILGLQTNRKNQINRNMTQFDHCNLRNVKVFLNSTYFPYENLNLNFNNNNYSLLYDQYAKFHQSYYGRQPNPLLGFEQFKSIAPLFVIDCSRQVDNLKAGGSVDVRIELESDTDIPDQTSAYCLILNDCIFEYKPLSNIVKKIS